VNQPDLLTIILLGIVEGLTEYLPVSSTGHLILAGELLGFSGEAGATFDIAIQSGAILAVLVAHWGRFMGVARGLLVREPTAFAFIRNVFLGFLPAAIMGVLFIKAVEAMLESPTTVAVSLIVGGFAILWIEKRMGEAKVFGVEALTPRNSLLIGMGQCVAMIPGVSRQMATSRSRSPQAQPGSSMCGSPKNARATGPSICTWTCLSFAASWWLARSRCLRVSCSISSSADGSPSFGRGSTVKRGLGSGLGLAWN
jgi:hypothetical protein